MQIVQQGATVTVEYGPASGSFTTDAMVIDDLENVGILRTRYRLTNFIVIHKNQFGWLGIYQV